MEKTESTGSTEQIAATAEPVATGIDRVTDDVPEKPRGRFAPGLIEGLKIVVGMLVFIGLAIYSYWHHPHLPMRH